MAETESQTPDYTDGTPSENPVDDVMATDLFASDDAEPSQEPAPAKSGTSTAFDPAEVDFRRTRLEDIPESHRRYYEPGFKAFADMQAGITKQSNDLSGQQAQTKQAEEEWRNRIQELSIGQQQQQVDPLNDQYSAMTPEQRDGVDVVKQLIQTEIQPFNQLTTTVQQLAETVSSLHQQSQTSQQNQVQAEVAEARTEYGNDIDQYGAQIGALKQTSNPLTGQPYSVKEAYELVSGRAQTVNNAARNQDVTARNSAKRTAGGPINTPVVSDLSQPGISLSEARGGLEELGFER